VGESAEILTRKETKNQLEVTVPCNYSGHLKAKVPLPFCLREGDHRGRVIKTSE
jgi:hypothetical protein